VQAKNASGFCHELAWNIPPPLCILPTMNPKLILKLLLVALALPIAALTSCNDKAKPGASSETTPEAKHHYAVAMTGVV